MKFTLHPYFRTLTAKPNLAGTEADLRVAKWLKEEFEKQGLDRVDILGYDILLSYPKDDDPSVITLFNG